MQDITAYFLIFVVVVGVIVVLTFIVKIAVFVKADQERERLRALAKEREEERRAELEKKKRELEEEARLQQERALAQIVEKAKTSVEERYRSGIPDGAIEEIDAYLRNAQLRQCHPGQVLTVQVVTMPTGRMAMEWALDPTLPYLVQVVCEKNNKVMFVDHAWRGVYHDMLARGKEYVFSFHVYDGKKDLEDDFEFVVKVPTEKQWERRVKEKKPLDAAARERRFIKKMNLIESKDAMREKARREAYARIDASNASDSEKRRRKAAFDAALEEDRRKNE